ncbi:MAG TPA: glycosyltransferase family 4 protein [Rhodothermales bacterium]
MKVLHLNEHLANKGGVETYMQGLLPMLRDRGIDVAWVHDHPAETSVVRSIQVKGIGKPGFRYQGEVRARIRELLEREKPDLVHLHNFQNVGVAQACLDLVPTVMTTHDYRSVCPANSFFYKRTQEICQKDRVGLGCFSTTVRKRCLTMRPQYASYYYYRSNWMLLQAHRFASVVAPSTGAQDRLLRAGYPTERTTVIPYFCPLKPAPEPRPLPERTTITFIGRIAPNKGQEFFVEALGKLPASVTGVMVGSFSNGAEETIRGLAVANGCADRLQLRKWADRATLLKIVDETTLLIFPSLWPETLGIVGLEAMSRGVPVVASDVGGVREWLDDRKNGVLVPAKSADKIRDAVLDLTSDRNVLMAYGQRAIQTINDRFLPETHVDRLLGVYEDVAGRV